MAKSPVVKVMDAVRRLGQIEEELSTLGCGNSGCAIYKPKGMATNGGCHCSYEGMRDHEMRRKIELALRLRQEQVKLMSTGFSC